MERFSPAPLDVFFFLFGTSSMWEEECTHFQKDPLSEEEIYEGHLLSPPSLGMCVCLLNDPWQMKLCLFTQTCLDNG